VYNAAAGYWSIASRCQAAATTVCAGEQSFAAGLIEACAQVCSTGEHVLYAAFDTPFLPSLDAFGLRYQPFACALLLGPQRMSPPSARCGTIDHWQIAAAAEGDEWSALNGTAPEKAASQPSRALADFFAGNASAAVLPLLAAIAMQEPKKIGLPYLDDAALELSYAP
jgi:hypothetical protein